MSFNFMAAGTIHSDFGAQEKKNLSLFPFFPIYLSLSDGSRCHDIKFLNVEFPASFFTFLFHPIKRIFSSSSLSAIRVVSSAYLRLLIFLPAILIPICNSSILHFARCDLHINYINRRIIYSLNMLLSQF